MDDAALAGGHGGEGVGLAGGANLLDGGLGEELQLAVAKDFEVVGVEGDAIVVFGFEAKDLSGDVLDGEEELSVAREEERGVGAGELDGELGCCRDQVWQFAQQNRWWWSAPGRCRLGCGA